MVDGQGMLRLGEGGRRVTMNPIGNKATFSLSLTLFLIVLIGCGQHSLSLTAPRGSQWADEIRSEQLPPGRYLVKLYIDQAGKLQEDFTAELGENEFVGQVEFESRWPVGYGRMTVVKFPVK